MENNNNNSNNTGKVPSYGGAQYRWNYDDYQREQTVKKSKIDKSRNIIGVAITVIFLIAFVSVMTVFITDAVLRSKGASLTAVFGSDYMTSEEVADIGIGSTVTVYCGNNENRAQVSGTVFRNDGYIITAANTIDSSMSVSAAIQGKSYTASIIGINSTYNIAVLKIDVNNLKTLKAGALDEVKAGSSAMITGLTTGIYGSNVGALPCSISNPDVDADIKALHLDSVTVINNTNINSIRLIQISEKINPELVGSPLLDMKGKIIGVVVARTSDGIGYAIPADDNFYVTINNIIDIRQLKALSVTAQTIPQENVGKYKISAGCLAINVNTDGKAYKAGIRENDIIISVNGQDVFTAYELEKLTDTNEKLTIRIRRSNDYIEIVIE